MLILFWVFIILMGVVIIDLLKDKNKRCSESIMNWNPKIKSNKKKISHCNGYCKHDSYDYDPAGGYL